MAARIIGIGQEWAGDDGVGLVVIRRLREIDSRLDLVELDEPSKLVELLTGGADPVVLIDAVLHDGPPGRVLVIEAQRHAPHCEHLLSTHGLGVMEAVELARITHPENVAQRIFIVGVTVQQTSRRGQRLSASAQAAVANAAETTLNLARTR